MGSKSWKVAASVLLTVKSSLDRRCSSKVARSLDTLFPEGEGNGAAEAIQMLVLRRGETDKHLPGEQVFPGGNLDSSDSNPEWFDLFKAAGFDESSFSCISDVDLLQGVQSSGLPGWMSLRLCAIRETFEESGILLGRASQKPLTGLPWASSLSISNLQSWQKRVREDPQQMTALCKAQSCVPDVWGLHLWSNWLTPVQKPVRHNTFFFMVALPTLPQYSLDNLEMDELKWCTAVELIEGMQARKHRLPNPQFYEASRLVSFCDADSLAAFAAKRAPNGCDCMMPVQQRAKDGLVFILPGDANYPVQIDYETSRDTDLHQCSLAELRDSVLTSGGKLHRMEILKKDGYPTLFVQNCTATCQHILPISTDEICQKFLKHKL